MRGLFLRAFRLVAVPALVTILIAACSGSAAPTSAPTNAPSAAETNSSRNTPTPGTPPTPAPSATAEPIPLAAWHLDADGTGSPGEPLTFVGTHAFDHGVVLDGVTGYGATPDAGPLDTTSSFTVAAWVSVSDKTAFASALSQVGETAAAFYLGVGEGDWAFSMKDLDSNAEGHTFRARGASPVVDPASWVHLAGVFDQPAAKIRLYVDGKPAAETSFNAPWQAHGALMAGGSKTRGALSDYWPGAIDAATVYQAALTEGAIARLRDVTRPTAVPPVLPVPADPALAVLHGTWDYPVAAKDPSELRQMIADAAAEAGKPEANVSLRFGFDGDRWWQGFVLDGELWLLHGVPEGDGGVMTVDGDKLTMTNAGGGRTRVRWTTAGDQLKLALTDCVDQSGECPDKDVVSLMTSHTFSRSGTDPTY